MNAYRQAVDDSIDSLLDVIVLVANRREQGDSHETVALAVWERMGAITKSLEQVFENAEAV